MIQKKQPKLAIVIHTEEEFDWGGGFNSQNNQVTHGEELITFCNDMISIGGKVTLAMDYAFVDSAQGQDVISHYMPQTKDIEFATHLHPWVNPPIALHGENINEVDSYPGNLEHSIELAKLTALTDKIASLAIKPSTYLAGRYGIGDNTHNILKALGYTLDISVSPFSDFSHQDGPNFSNKNNNLFKTDDIISCPHTTSITSLFGLMNKYYHRHPAKFEQHQSNTFTRLLTKLLRVKRQRLSPEGFDFIDMKKITEAQIELGQEYFIFSFHSPSVKLGLTPYVNNADKLAAFTKNTMTYLKWFKSIGGEFILCRDIKHD